MIEKLQIIQQRFDEVSDLIIQPDIIADQKRYVQLNKEYKDLSKLVEKGKTYTTLLANQTEAMEIIKDGGDAEMVEMAKMQLEEAKENLPALEEEIRFYSFPKTRKTPKTLWLKFAQEREGMKPVFLQVTSTACIQNIVPIEAGPPV